MKIAIDMGIFDLAISRDEVTVEEIATSAGADQVLVGQFSFLPRSQTFLIPAERIMRSLVISGLFNATPRNTYTANDGATALSSQGSMHHMVSFIQ